MIDVEVLDDLPHRYLDIVEVLVSKRAKSFKVAQEYID